jgi:SAM-dependent methyltransferase
LADQIVGVARFRQKIAEVEKHLANSKLMLDFGCGSGKYLDRAKKFGCLTLGMDFSSQALEQVRSRGHKALPVDDEAWDSLGAGKIGFVRMNHVIEHLYQPKQTLKKIFLAMAPDAVLHLSTPNPTGPSATKYRAAWWGLECPRHIVLLTPERTVALLEEAGFCQMEVLHEPLTKDIVRSWAYTRVDRGAIANDIVEGLAEDGLLNLWFSLAIISEIRRGRGSDRYHVIARKGNGKH